MSKKIDLRIEEAEVDEGYLRWALAMLKIDKAVFSEAFRQTMSYKLLEEYRERGIDPDLIDEIEGYLTANEL